MPGGPHCAGKNATFDEARKACVCGRGLMFLPALRGWRYGSLTNAQFVTSLKRAPLIWL